MRAKPTIQWTDRLEGLACGNATKANDFKTFSRWITRPHAPTANGGYWPPTLKVLILPLQNLIATRRPFVSLLTGVSGAIATASALVEMKRQQSDDEEKSRLEGLNGKSCSAAYTLAGAV